MRNTAPALALALLLLAAPAWAQQDDGDTDAIDDTPHVTIVGTASTEVAPDLATVSAGVAVERPTATEASAEMARQAAAVTEAARAQGVAAADIRTQALHLSQVFDEVRDAAGRVTGQKPRGFLAETVLEVRTRALDKAGALAQGLVEKGANRLNGVSFAVEHPEPVYDRLHAEAVHDARRKAGLAAEAAGVRLGRVLLIERPEAAGGGAPVFRMAAAPALPAAPGMETLRVEMAVTWALE